MCERQIMRPTWRVVISLSGVGVVGLALWGIVSPQHLNRHAPEVQPVRSEMVGECGLAARCAGACTDLLADATHCGSCGHRCGSDTVCARGRCVNINSVDARSLASRGGASFNLLGGSGGSATWHRRTPRIGGRIDGVVSHGTSANNLIIGSPGEASGAPPTTARRGPSRQAMGWEISPSCTWSGTG